MIISDSSLISFFPAFFQFAPTSYSGYYFSKKILHLFTGNSNLFTVFFMRKTGNSRIFIKTDTNTGPSVTLQRQNPRALPRKRKLLSFPSFPLYIPANRVKPAKIQKKISSLCYHPSAVWNHITKNNQNIIAEKQRPSHTGRLKKKKDLSVYIRAHSYRNSLFIKDSACTFSPLERYVRLSVRPSIVRIPSFRSRDWI